MRKKTLYGYLMLAPSMLILIGIFGVGVIESIMQSFGYFPAIGQTTWTLQYYKEIFTNPYFLESFIYTFSFAFISSALAVIMGVIVSYALVRTKKAQTIVEQIVKIPVYVPHIVTVVLMTLVFNQTGIIARLWYMLGLIDDPSQFMVLVQDPYGIGITLVYLWKGVPFTLITIYTILKGLDGTLVLAARNLGASTKEIFWRIQLPLIMPSALSTFIILFAFAFGSFEVPYLMGANIPEALPVWAYNQYTSSQVEHRMYAMVLNTMMMIVSFGLLMGYLKINKQIKKYR